jgi:hypothetical protein
LKKKEKEESDQLTILNEKSLIDSPIITSISPNISPNISSSNDSSFDFDLQTIVNSQNAFVPNKNNNSRKNIVSSSAVTDIQLQYKFDNNSITEVLSNPFLSNVLNVWLFFFF